MRILSTKIILLLFGLFNLILNNVIQIRLKPRESEGVHARGPYLIYFWLFDHPSYYEYIRIVVSLDRSETKKNPFVIVASDSSCRNRIYASAQLYEPIYIYLKYKYLPSLKMFYVCIESRDNNDNYDFYITADNQDKAYLPFNRQASFYNYNGYFNKIEFSFTKDGSEKTSTDISFWVRGKYLKKAEMPAFNGNKKKQIESGYVFYGPLQSSDNYFNLTIETYEGDYVTVGSATFINSTSYNKLLENRNEILIASKNDEVCFPLSFEAKIMHITGKIYTLIAKGYFSICVSPIFNGSSFSPLK